VLEGRIVKKDEEIAKVQETNKKLEKELKEAQEELEKCKKWENSNERASGEDLKL